MRAETTWARLLAVILVAAGISLQSLVWACEIDPWGLATRLLPAEGGPILIAYYGRFLCQAIVMLTLFLIAAVIADAPEVRPAERRSFARN
ncbi:hypothetical protein [Fimbriiglobus ruber]|uniref:Uncharacterized protein n=1 Tax=Fimbriiglobus ruber TaxID=1908690 RepID=A0A225DZT3_9BACT|nr:hypothetical protein [Fimbriiglobus ruber]OWK46483.1 hypothetical protein FRUB_00182 [Fimbriiglobus ruber]